MADRTAESAPALIQIVRDLAAEIDPEKQNIPVTLAARLDRDLGLDSLARAELLTRIERRLGVTLPEQLLGDAETLGDLADALSAAPGAPPSVSTEVAAFREPKPDAAPDRAETLLDVLDWHVNAHPEQPHIVLEDDSGAERVVRFAELHNQSSRIAHALHALDLDPGDRVAIMLPTSLEYFFSFCGILLGGFVPVPVYPPVRPSQLEEHLRRHAAILRNAQAVVLITVAQAKPLARLLKAQVESLRSIVTAEELLRNEGRPISAPAIKPDDLALLQYTSGATGNPKGVMLSHHNLLANIRAMGEAVRANANDVFVSWLPLYHDMGLIGAWLGSLYYGALLSLMSPLTFLAHPQRWLWAIHKRRGTLSGGPNFAYELCVKRVRDEDIEGLDLSSWRFAFNGAESVSPETLIKFKERYSRYGLREEALAPVYGLAEVSVGLAFPPQGRGPLIDRVDRDAFMKTGVARPAPENDADALRFVACGRPLPEHAIRIVDSAGREVGDREEGRLQFQGPSATSGYFRNPEETRRLIRGKWLDSGDYAYMAGGEVYLTGRAKDIVIRAGRNIYPHELEEAVGAIPGIRKGCVAVFGNRDAASATERLVVMAETREASEQEKNRLREKINDVAVGLLGSPPDDVALVPPHGVLKTSSGKIRRAACRESYETGAGRPRAVWWQVARVAWASVLPGLRRSRRTAADLVHAAYVWVVFWSLAPITWLACAMLPRGSLPLSRRAARLFLRLSGTPPKVEGTERLAQRGPCVFVANHASYLDGIVLIAALPTKFSFVAKRELLEHLVSRVYLKRIGTEFVERFDARQGVEDTDRLAGLLRAGRSLFFFPEGTFTRSSGVLPFHMGAFLTAAQVHVPVVPVTIRGTRSILRQGHWLPRRGEIVVSVGPPITPEESDWRAALKLRDAARSEIVRASGEPDIARIS
jgi:1-acyl-sn-glycerol-3-phosphate acyltransferase